jgi:hypothetical protein
MEDPKQEALEAASTKDLETRRRTAGKRLR